MSELDKIGQTTGDVGSFLENIASKSAGISQQEESTREAKKLFPTQLAAQQEALQQSRAIDPVNLEVAKAKLKQTLSPEFKSKVAQQIYEHNQLAATLGENNDFVKADAVRLHNLLETDPNQSAADKAALTEKAQDFEKYKTAISDIADAANDTDNEVDNFNTAYRQIPAPGFTTSMLGKGAAEAARFATGGAVGGDTLAALQSADKSAKRLGLSMAGLLKNFKGTGFMYDFLANSTLNTHLAPRAVANLTREIKAATAQQKLRPLFTQALSANGVKDPNVARNLWMMYVNQNPALERPKKGLVPKIRLDNLEKWSQYTTPEAIESARSGRIYQSPDVSARPGIAGEPTIKASDGKVYTITQLQHIANQGVK
jgi:hypothetical protein